MTDVNQGFATAYIALKGVFEDLNRLAGDFGEALRERGCDFTSSLEYSHSPNSLVLKKSHAWMFHAPIDAKAAKKDKALIFGACLAYFDADGTRWKVTAAGRPELWFFLGKTWPPPEINFASVIQTFFDKADLEFFHTKPTLGGDVAAYTCPGPDRWEAVCLGFELGAITSRERLVSLAVDPLVASATKVGIVGLR